ncbi:MAG: MBL fold metallo-hydrolase [Solobacterium sp.]|nr:MBL fold metallo-hydrolase [Solobacterium sp.]
MTEEWFTVEQIDRDTFAISEYGHWEQAHCYLLIGETQAALIDTGMGVSDIRKVTDQLTQLPVRVLTTHVHWDHIGGHGLYSDLSVHELEQEWLESSFPLPEAAVRQNLTCMSCRFPEGFDPAAYHVFQGKASHLLHDGDSIDLGNRKIIVIHTPGHSPGHCCFWEADRQYLYTGDLIYSGCLYAYYPSTDPYQFWQSIRKAGELPVRRILPGHNRLDIGTDIIERIETAFAQLYKENELKQGSGLFDYPDFQIHI